MDSLPWLLPLLVYFFTRFILLTVSLWIMLRIQELNYTIPGIIFCSALASACDSLPVPIGAHALAVGVLIFSVIKLTRAHFVDVRFTVVISYAVMFLIQMLIISAVPFDLNVFARSHKDTLAKLHLVPDDGGTDGLLSTNGSLATSPADKPSDNPSPAAKPSQDTNHAVPSSSGLQAAAPSNTQPVATPASIPALSKKVVDAFSLKGVMGNPGNMTVMIGTGTRTYSLQVGETAPVDTTAGKMDVTVTEATQNRAVLKINGNLLPLEIH